jgi:hypothetical protein
MDTEMKHAYLIVAHQDMKMLMLLLEAIDDERNDIFLHIDTKSPQLYAAISKHKLRHSQLHIYSRFNVMWGDISLALLELFLFETAATNGQYNYFHLLSGVDYPLKSQDYIHKFCKDNYGKQFIGYDKNNESWIQRYQYKWYFTKYYKDPNLFKRAFFRTLTQCAYFIQHIVGYKRDLGYTEIKKGCNWLSLSDKCVKYILSQKEVVISKFRYILAVDEIFLHTILWNSPFRDDIYDINDEYKSCLREIDWRRGTPYEWQLEDVNFLLNSEKLFARKFTSKNISLIRTLNDGNKKK